MWIGAGEGDVFAVEVDVFEVGTGGDEDGVAVGGGFDALLDGFEGGLSGGAVAGL